MYFLIFSCAVFGVLLLLSAYLYQRLQPSREVIRRTGSE
jgi:hypothetical protein